MSLAGSALLEAAWAVAGSRLEQHGGLDVVAHAGEARMGGRVALLVPETKRAARGIWPAL